MLCCAVLQTTASTSTTAAAVGGGGADEPRGARHARGGPAVTLATPFRRSQFVSLSWSEKRGRRGGGGPRTRRARRRLSDPYQQEVVDVMETVGGTYQTMPDQSSNAPAVFCRSDWKRQVIGVGSITLWDAVVNLDLV